ncbi:MAG TPA: 6-carboxytetrahydropterin synthase [Chitinophagaceae bacterium]|nr:6-carboxytetrahydropterin synthase [Chitinophagaceae bacterium]
MIYLTRVEHFNAAHKLYNLAWDKGKNELVFGKCANENWHGHNYELHVTIKGTVSEETGFLFDVKKLSLLIKEHVIEKLDHKNLNVDVDFLKGKMCSTENVAKAIWEQLTDKLPAGSKLHCIKLVETPRIYVEYFGE